MTHEKFPQHLPDVSRTDDTRRKCGVFLLCYIVLLICIEYEDVYLCCVFVIFAYFIMKFLPIL